MTRRISYAQNGEDVLLHRALGRLSGVTYVDVGAGHPTVDSVSKSLHALGWRGLHVEPVPSYARQLREQRPKDVVVEAAAGVVTGSVPFWFVADSGLSTTSEADALEARKRGWPVQASTVEARRLDDLIDENLGGSPLHALKVDVAGNEGEVLQGVDLGRHRPWVVVVAATRPLSTDRTEGSWEPLLIEQGYTSVLFDGLNRWYVSPEHPELAERLSYPACAHDEWSRTELGFPAPRGDGLAEALSGVALELVAARAAQVAAEQLAAGLKEEVRRHQELLKQQRAEASQLAARVRAAENDAARSRAAHQAIESSTFWRLTAPLRWLADRVKRKPKSS
jgi:FkbM family methyltransferase